MPMTKRLIEKIAQLWPTWRNDARVAALGSSCKGFKDAQIEPIVDAMYAEGVQWFDDRELRKRLMAGDGAENLSECNRINAMDARQWTAWRARQDFIGYAPRHPKGPAALPDFAKLDDEQILDIHHRCAVYRLNLEAKVSYPLMSGRHKLTKKTWTIYGKRAEPRKPADEGCLCRKCEAYRAEQQAGPKPIRPRCIPYSAEWWSAWRITGFSGEESLARLEMARLMEKAKTIQALAGKVPPADTVQTVYDSLVGAAT